jgi:hypothetical protein
MKETIGIENLYSMISQCFVQLINKNLVLKPDVLIPQINSFLSPKSTLYFIAPLYHLGYCLQKSNHVTKPYDDRQPTPATRVAWVSVAQ